MSEWNDALEAAAEICDMRSIPQGGYLTEMDIRAAECAIAIRGLKRPEAEPDHCQHLPFGPVACPECRKETKP